MGKRIPSPNKAELAAKLPRGQRANQIRDLHARFPGLGYAALAKRVGVSRQTARTVVQSFMSNHTEEELREFQEGKAQVYDSIQLRILESATDEKMKTASIGTLVTAAAILEDKSRVIRGQATSFNVNVLLDVAQMIRYESDK